MSHIVTVATEVRDPIAVAAACLRLGLPEPARGTAELFEGQVAELLVELPGWLYPVACDVDTGRLHYDNYHGRWGKQEQLDPLIQAYALEKASFEARNLGHSVSEQALADGSVRLTIRVGGAE